MTLTIDKQQIKVLYNTDQITSQIKRVAEQITNDYKDIKSLIVVGVLKGAFIFTADLVRALKVPCQVEFIRLSSYEGTQSSGEFKVYDLTLPLIKDRHILICDDIVDSGRTADFLFNFFENQAGVASIKMVSLFDKPCRRDPKLKNFKPDYCCFEIDNKFILGYGLDYEQKFRELPYVGYVEGLC